jgi:DNA-binding transcriptional ArsR family regulator
LSTYEKKDESQRIFEEVARYFFLLSDPTRLRILSCLCNGERSVGEVVTHIGLTQANISRHLSVLLNAKVVGRRREGSSNFYHVSDPNFVDICRTVSVRVASKVLPGIEKTDSHF